MLATRGALTSFSIASAVGKYFAIIPVLLAIRYPQLRALNIIRLASPKSAVLAAVLFNAVTIIALVPLASHGVKARFSSAARKLRHNALIYGLGGVLVSFLGYF